MKIFFDYKREKLMTEQEAKEYIAGDVWEDSYGIWEFITEHYSYSEIIGKLPREFIKEIVETIIENRLENEELFCVRDF